jgi:outer membrane PBP1 activator LpoA protein
MQIIHSTAVLISIVLLFLVGCTLTSKDSIKPTKDETTSFRLEVIERLDDDDYVEAASLLEEAARESESPEREQLMLEAAEYWLKAGKQERSLSLLEQLKPSRQNDEFNFRLRMLRTELAMMQGDIEKALDLMQPEPTPDTPLELRQHYHLNMAEIFRLSGNLLESARELDLLDKLLEEEPEERLATQKLLIQTLTTMTDTALTLLQPQPPATLVGWMELAKVLKQQISDPSAMDEQIERWQKRFPDHPAMPVLLADYPQQQGLTLDDHIAILLPRSGPYAKVAAAVRDGFMVAWYQQPPEYRPRLRFYDTSSLQNTLDIYQQAILNGAQMIVGPLDKNAVKMLTQLDMLEIPILALNQADSSNLPVDPNFFQFGLAPEDEAEQVAERAWLEGYRNVLILTPSNDWGKRLAQSFQIRWRKLGGHVLEEQHYSPKEDDFSLPIRTLLNIDESQARIKALQNQLGRKIKAEPRRRKDADFIFLAARPQKARQLRPQLKFFRAGNLPILSTSHIYSGIPNVPLDRDLGTISFVDTPWLLDDNQRENLSRQELEKLIPGVKSRYARLYAMGIDSFNLLSQLHTLQDQPGRLYNGKSGALYLDQQNRLHRLLAWVNMEDGQAKIIGYAPRLEMSTPQTPIPLGEDPQPGAPSDFEHDTSPLDAPIKPQPDSF